jgi:hypothetical protein
MLAALYGKFGGEKRADWQLGIARIVQTLTAQSFQPSSHADIVGNPAWNPRLLSAKFQLRLISAMPARVSFEESGTVHTRLSQDLPSYTSRSCQTALPLEFSGTFQVDSSGVRRPGPFTPPKLTFDYTFQNERGKDAGNSGHRRDENPQYQGAGLDLHTDLSSPVKLSFHDNGTFTTLLRMEDPDSKSTVQYDDRIQVNANVPCGAGAAK